MQRRHCIILTAAARGLAGSGELSSPVTLPFEFANVEMQYDSYKGTQVREGGRWIESSGWNVLVGCSTSHSASHSSHRPCMRRVRRWMIAFGASLMPAGTNDGVQALSSSYHTAREQRSA